MFPDIMGGRCTLYSPVFIRALQLSFHIANHTQVIAMRLNCYKARESQDMDPSPPLFSNDTYRTTKIIHPQFHIIAQVRRTTEIRFQGHSSDNIDYSKPFIREDPPRTIEEPFQISGG